MAYKTNINFTEKPQLLTYGDNYCHVPLNITEQTATDDEGNEITVYTADVVEKVSTPVSVDNIVKAAATAKFGSDIFDYVALNITNTEDEKVVSYTAFVSKIKEQATELGYE